MLHLFFPEMISPVKRNWTFRELNLDASWLLRSSRSCMNFFPASTCVSSCFEMLAQWERLSQQVFRKKWGRAPRISMWRLPHAAINLSSSWRAFRRRENGLTARSPSTWKSPSTSDLVMAMRSPFSLMALSYNKMVFVTVHLSFQPPFSCTLVLKELLG